MSAIVGQMTVVVVYYKGTGQTAPIYRVTLTPDPPATAGYVWPDPLPSFVGEGSTTETATEAAWALARDYIVNRNAAP